MGDELLLLAIAPGWRRIRVRSPERVRFALRAAELAELALAGRIAVGERAIEVRDRAHVGTPRLDNVLAALASAKPPPSLGSWLRGAPRGLTAEYLSRLRDQKSVRFRRERDRVGRTRYDILSLDTERRAEVAARVAAAVLAAAGSAGEPDEYDLTLAVLVRLAGIGSAVHPGLRGAADRRRLAALTAADGALDGAVAEAAGGLDQEVAGALGTGIESLTRNLRGELSEIYSDTTTGGHGLGHDLSSGGWSDSSSGGGHHGGGDHGGGGHGGW